MVGHDRRLPRPTSARRSRRSGGEALRGGFGTTFCARVFAGWLIALMVWLLPYAEAARVSVILIVTYVVGLGGFAHVIAGSVEVFYLVVDGQGSWAR